MDKNELRLLEGHNIIITPVKDGASDEYPWAYNSQKMRLEKVYSSYILVTVLPHTHPNGFGLSNPYTTTINFIDIASPNANDGLFIINKASD